MAHDAHSQTDFEDHVRTYEGFIGLTKWSVILIIVILVLMAFFLL